MKCELCVGEFKYTIGMLRIKQDLIDLIDYRHPFSFLISVSVKEA
jgi:hypothetical protein